MPLAFAYHRSIAPNLAVLLGLAIVEALVLLALAEWRNVVVDVDTPVPGRRRPIRAVAQRLGDPEAFTRALEEAR